MRPMKFGFGQPVRRVEDQRLTTGTGRYTDDTAVEGALHAFVLRSQYAHATFRIVDKQAALGMKAQTWYSRKRTSGQTMRNMGGRF